MHPPPSPTEVSKGHRAQGRRMGVICLGVCVVAFTIQSEAARLLQHNLDFPKPYFILFVSHTLHFLLLPCQILYERIHQGSIRPYLSDVRRSLPLLLGMESQAGEYTTLHAQGPSILRLFFLLVRRVTILAILINICGYFWYVGADLTTPARLTAAYNTTAGFAYVFAVLLIGERRSMGKTLGVLLGIFGVAVTALSAPEGGAEGGKASHWTGDAAGLASAVLAGYYEVLYRRDYVVESPDGKVNIPMANTVTGAMGVANILFLWPPFLLLHWLGWEAFALPSLPTFGAIVCVGLLGVTYNSMFMLAVALVGPVVACVGVMCTIPLVAIVDWVGFGMSLGLGGIIGCGMVCGAFIIMTREPDEEEGRGGEGNGHWVE